MHIVTAYRVQLSTCLNISKAVKAISCKTNVGVSTAIIAFFVGGASWTLDSSMEVEWNAKFTKKFISVAA